MYQQHVDNEDKKKPQAAFQVHHEELQGNDGPARLLEARPDSIQSIFSFSFSEFSFDCIALARIQLCDLFPFCRVSLLRRPAERRSAEPNAALFAIRSVLTIPVDLIGQNLLWVHPEAFLIRLYRFDQ